jgi:hypothetical protein
LFICLFVSRNIFWGFDDANLVFRSLLTIWRNPDVWETTITKVLRKSNALIATMSFQSDHSESQENPEINDHGHFEHAYVTATTVDDFSANSEAAPVVENVPQAFPVPSPSQDQIFLPPVPPPRRVRQPASPTSPQPFKGDNLILWEDEDTSGIIPTPAPASLNLDDEHTFGQADDEISPPGSPMPHTSSLSSILLLPPAAPTSTNPLPPTSSMPLSTTTPVPVPVPVPMPVSVPVPAQSISILPAHKRKLSIALANPSAAPPASPSLSIQSSPQGKLIPPSPRPFVIPVPLFSSSIAPSPGPTPIPIKEVEPTAEKVRLDALTEGDKKFLFADTLKIG